MGQIRRHEVIICIMPTVLLSTITRHRTDIANHAKYNVKLNNIMVTVAHRWMSGGVRYEHVVIGKYYVE